MKSARLAVVCGCLAIFAVAKAWRESTARGRGSATATDSSDTANATPDSFAAPPAPPTQLRIDDEADLMRHLRDPNLDPWTALSLSREGNRRYPDSPLCDERTFREIRALVDLNQIGEAHTLARAFVQTHPDGTFTARVTNLMGVRPHREGSPLQR